MTNDSIISSTAATTGVTILSIVTVYPDMLIAAMCGGVLAIITIDSLTLAQRIKCMITAVLSSALVGPIAVKVLPRIVPDYLLPTDQGELHLLIGGTIGFIAYKAALPELLSFISGKFKRWQRPK